LIVLNITSYDFLIIIFFKRSVIKLPAWVARTTTRLLAKLAKSHANERFHCKNYRENYDLLLSYLKLFFYKMLS